MEALQQEYQAVPSHLKKYFRPGAILCPRPAIESDLILGQSRMGGRPDLPPDHKWPEYENKHQVFIAQINLEELEGWAVPMGLPKSGHLFFFHDQDMSWQLGPKQENCPLVLYSSVPAKNLSRAEFPDDLRDEDKRRLCSVGIHCLQLQAPPWSQLYETFDSSNKDDVAVFKKYREDCIEYVSGALHRSDEDGERPWHVLGGFADIVQDPVESECVSYFSDLSEEEQDEMTMKESLAFEEQQDKAARDWLLLFQCDYDSIADTCWYDMGKLFYMIRQQDLASLAFDQTVAIIESH